MITILEKIKKICSNYFFLEQIYNYDLNSLSKWNINLRYLDCDEYIKRRVSLNALSKSK